MDFVTLFSFLFSAVYVSLTAIILVDLLGVNLLATSFGYVNFCRGIATLIGSPLAGG